MTMRKILLGAVTIAVFASGTAWAQPGWVPPGNDPAGYYSDLGCPNVKADNNGLFVVHDILFLVVCELYD